MAKKKEAKTRTPEHTYPVAFDAIRKGKERSSVGIAIDAGAITDEDAMKIFRGKELEVDICRVDDGQESHTTSGTALSRRVGFEVNTVTSTLSFALPDGALGTFGRLAGRGGLIKVYEVTDMSSTDKNDDAEGQQTFLPEE